MLGLCGIVPLPGLIEGKLLNQLWRTGSAHKPPVELLEVWSTGCKVPYTTHEQFLKDKEVVLHHYEQLRGVVQRCS